MKNLLLLVILLTSVHLFGQKDTSTWRIITTDGNTYTGTIVGETQDTLIFQSESLGNLNIPQAMIRSKERLTLRNPETGEFWPKNHHSTRYFFGPNAITLGKGEGYYQNNWVFFNQVSYGITDHFTIGLGGLPIWLLGAPAFPLWITPKIGYPVGKNLHLGAGALAGSLFSSDENIAAGIGYGLITWGDSDNNLTLGAGYGFAGGDISNSPTVSLSAMKRLSKKTYIMTENYWFGVDNGGLFSVGARTAWTNLALDYGLIVPSVFLEGDGLIAIPWLGISIPFGHKKENRRSN